MSEKIILFTEEQSGLNARCRLLTEAAPQGSQFLWDFALEKPTFEGIHAIWTGPEISCPVPAQNVPDRYREQGLPYEHTTMFPQAGDIAVAFVAPGQFAGMPPNLSIFDLGLFYDDGARMLMPFGWFAVPICAKVINADRQNYTEACNRIRRQGASNITLQTVNGEE